MRIKIYRKQLISTFPANAHSLILVFISQASNAQKYTDEIVDLEATYYFCVSIKKIAVPSPDGYRIFLSFSSSWVPPTRFCPNSDDLVDSTARQNDTTSVGTDAA